MQTLGLPKTEESKIRTLSVADMSKSPSAVVHYRTARLRSITLIRRIQLHDVVNDLQIDG